MIRFIVRTTDIGDAVHVDGAPVLRTFKTFDLWLPELEAYLREAVPYGDPPSYQRRDIVGIEILDIPPECSCAGGPQGDGLVSLPHDPTCPVFTWERREMRS